ncbi:hypothetical protein P0E82_14325, partial [Enterococcus faecalis]
RNSSPFPFQVRINYSHMRVEPAPQSDDLGEPSAATGSSTGSGDRKKRRTKEVPNLGEMNDQ